MPLSCIINYTSDTIGGCMNKQVKQLIETHIELIQSNQFSKIYDLLYFGGEDEPVIGEFTITLMNAGIDPIIYLKCIPQAYLDSSSITTMDIPENIQAIEAGAFFASKLNEIYIPKSIEYIESHAFDFCIFLKSVKFEEGCQSVGHKCFCECASLSKVILPSSLEYIGDETFKNCFNLTELYYNGTIEKFKHTFDINNVLRGSRITSIHCSDGDVE